VPRRGRRLERAYDALVEILRGTKLVNRRLERSGAARATFLRDQLQRAGLDGYVEERSG
jgi:hypothetical protein